MCLVWTLHCLLVTIPCVYFHPCCRRRQNIWVVMASSWCTGCRSWRPSELFSNQVCTYVCVFTVDVYCKVYSVCFVHGNDSCVGTWQGCFKRPTSSASHQCSHAHWKMSKKWWLLCQPQVVRIYALNYVQVLTFLICYFLCIACREWQCAFWIASSTTCFFNSMAWGYSVNFICQCLLSNKLSFCADQQCASAIHLCSGAASLWILD